MFYLIILILIILLFLLYYIYLKKILIEKFKNLKKKKIKISFLQNTPEPLKIILEMQKLGLQLEADGQYDSVAKKYLK